MIKPAGRTPLYPRVQCWGDNDFIFPVRPLTIPTLRSGEGAGDVVSIVVVANFCPSTVWMCRL